MISQKIREDLLVFAGQVWQGWASLWQDPLRSMISLSLILLGLVFLLAGYVIFLRWRAKRRQVLNRAKMDGWRGMVLDVLTGDGPVEIFVNGVAPKHYRLFGEFIKPYLEDIAGAEKQKLIHILQKLEYPRFLLSRLAHLNQWERAFAIQFFGLMEDRRFLKELRVLLESRFDVVRFAAAEVLMKLKDESSVWPVINRFSREAEYSQDRIIILLSTFGPEILPELARVFRGKKLTIRLQTLIVNMFQQYQHAEMVWDVLTLAAQTRNQELRIACLAALADFEEPALSGFFEKSLYDPEPVVAAIAARALGEVGDGSSLEKLRPKLDDSNFWVVKHTTESMCLIGDGGREMLEDELAHSHPVQTMALIREALAFEH
ncbi:MAG: HEAT repeat domain-containing protein [Deltaproteobacteria bacterium]|nr:HEAT repeat domain-containing protein [Deltaproteobacteria bacterium]